MSEDNCIRFLKKAFNLPYSVFGVNVVEVYTSPEHLKNELQGIRFKDGEIRVDLVNDRCVILDETHLYAIYRTLKYLDWFEWLK